MRRGFTLIELMIIVAIVAIIAAIAIPNLLESKAKMLYEKASKGEQLDAEEREHLEEALMDPSNHDFIQRLKKEYGEAVYNDIMDIDVPPEEPPEPPQKPQKAAVTKPEADEGTQRVVKQMDALMQRVDALTQKVGGEIKKDKDETQKTLEQIREEVKRLRQELALEKNKPRLHTYRVVDRRDMHGWKYDVIRDDGVVVASTGRKSEAEKVQEALEEARENGRAVGQYEGSHK